MRSIIPAVYHYCFEVFVKSEPYSLTNTYFPGGTESGKIRCQISYKNNDIKSLPALF